jgi:hypothetical protein
MRKQTRQRADILAMNLDELQRARARRAAYLAMHGSDQRAFAHAARTPQQRVVGGQPRGETLRIAEQGVAHTIYTFEQR